MRVYWIVWISMIALAYLCQNSDFSIQQRLTTGRTWHTSSARTWYILAAIILIMIAGCRYYVGADFGGYYNTSPDDFEWLTRLKTFSEPGIRFVYWIAVRLHDSNGMCIWFTAAVTIGLQMSMLYKNTDNIGFALALFTFCCWSSCFNGVRQDLAAAVLFCGLPALRDRKFVKYALVVFLAFLFHRSALVMILVYFMIDRKADTKNIVLLIVLSVVVLYSYDKVYDVINVVMDNDVTGEEAYWSTSVNILRTLSKIAPVVYFLYLYRDIKKTPTVSFYLNLLVVHAVVAVTTSTSACLARMSMYTAPFAVIAMAELIKILPKDKRKIMSIVIVALYWIMEYIECSKGSMSPFQLRWFW